MAQIPYVVADSLENVRENGETTGFRITVRITNGRGSFLSLLNGFLLQVDDVPYGLPAQRLAVHGLPPRDMETLAHASDEYWQYTEPAVLYIAHPGGLAPGAHEVVYQDNLMSGWFKADDGWVDHPPAPGANPFGRPPARYTCTLRGEEA